VGNRVNNSFQDSQPKLCDKTPIELFRLFYDNEMSSMIRTETVRYARQKNNNHFDPTEIDITTFMGILLFSGYPSLPRQDMYWCRDEDLQTTFVSSLMTKNKFIAINKFLHLADNDNIGTTDKMFRVRQFLSSLNERLCQFNVFSKYLSIDEEMVPL